MKKTGKLAQALFWLELILAILIPFIVWWSMTPTNILNSNSMFRLLECVGSNGSILICFAGIPIGLIGIIKAKKMENLRIATIMLSLINLFAGIIEVGMLILIFCKVIFGGVSV